MATTKLNQQLERAANSRYVTASREAEALDQRLLRFEVTMCNRLTRAAWEGDSVAQEYELAMGEITAMIGRSMERTITKTQRQGIADAKRLIPEECYDAEVDALARSRGPEGLRVARVGRSELPTDNRPAPGQLLNASQRELLPEVLSLPQKQRIVLRRMADDERFRIITTSFVEGQRRTWDSRVTRIGRRVAPRSLGRQLQREVEIGSTRKEIKEMACQFSRRVINQARTIGRTEVMRVYRLTDDHIIEKFEECQRGYRYMTVGDDRVRPSHARLHGRLYRRREDGSFTDSRGNEMPVPPWAPNCRCWLVPLLKNPVTGESLIWPRHNLLNETSPKRSASPAAKLTHRAMWSAESRSWVVGQGMVESIPTEPCEKGCTCTKEPRSTSTTTNAKKAVSTRTILGV